MNDNVTPIDTAKPQNTAGAVEHQMTTRELESMARIERKHERLLEQLAEWPSNEHRASEFRALAFHKRINANKCENLAYRLRQDNGSET